MKEDKKILVFTESKDTFEYLEKKIKAWGYAINAIHGFMRLEDRIKAEGIFKNEELRQRNPSLPFFLDKMPSFALEFRY